MTLQLTLIALIVSAGLYGAIAYGKSRNIKTIKDFFHINNVTDGALSIVAGNLTLGTGLFYVASLAQKQALFALLAPLGVLFGYFLLRRVVTRLTLSVEGRNHNILDSIRTGAGGEFFYFFLSLIIVLTFLVIIPFEIYVSSSLFASVLPPDQSENMSIVFAIVLFFIVVLYSALGGLRGIVATDKIQLAFIVLMLLIVLVGAFFIDGSGIKKQAIGLMPSGGFVAVLVLSISSFITAVSTQMYNIINLSIGTSFNSDNQLRLFRIAGWVLFFALVAFVLTGLATHELGSSNLAGIDILLGNMTQNASSFLSLLVFLVVFGMVAVLISTADSGIMAIAHIAYSNVFRMNSYLDEGGSKLWFTRIVFVIILNGISAIPLILIFKNKPDLIPLLLTSISALTVSAPFMVSAAINIARSGCSLMSNLYIALIISILVLSVWAVSIWKMLAGDYETGNYLIISGVVLGMLFYLLDTKISNTCVDKSVISSE